MRKTRRRFVSEINVTPFVDVLLVILVIFMISAPMITTNFEVSLPQTDNNQSQNESSDYINLTIDKAANVFYKKQLINMNLEKALINYNKIKSQVFIRADKDVRYEAVMLLMNELKQIGFESISLVTEVR